MLQGQLESSTSFTTTARFDLMGACKAVEKQCSFKIQNFEKQ